jgi:DNA-binding response OmpR family regulator
VDGWFARLVAAELGIATRSFLDVGAREIVVGTARSPLTRREFDTLQYLLQRAGSVVHRDDLLTGVWGEASDIGSTVVDVAIRSLRKKGQRAGLIQTVSGVGYRLRDDE